MKKSVKVLSFLLAMVMLFALATGCGKDKKNDKDSNDVKKPDATTSSTTTPTTGSSDNTANNSSYTVSIKTFGGMPMQDVDVYIYSDSTLSDMKDAKKTDANGLVSFNLPTGNDYAITLEGVPAGYDKKAYYSFDGNTAVIT